MVNCSFCKKEVARGTGLLFIQKIGKQFLFCKKKCKINMINQKKSPLRTKWVTKQKKQD